jgi:hypothetical protein
MFHIIYDINTLKFEQLFPLVLALHIKKSENEGEEKLEKEVVTRELRKLLIYLFRAITLKGEYPRDISNKVTYQLIKKVKSGQTLFEFEKDNKKYEKYEGVVEQINDEFDKNKGEKLDEIYQLLNSSPKAQNNNVRKFIFKFYYFEKYLIKKKINRDKKEDELEYKIAASGFRNEIIDYEVEHLVSKIPRKKDEEKHKRFKKIKENIGNITLVKTEDNKKLSNRG